MRKMLLVTVIFAIQIMILIATVASTAEVEQKQNANEEMYFFGNKTEFSNSMDITQIDVDLMWEKVQLGIQLIDQFWQVKFNQNGISNYYRRPQVEYYTSPVSTGCGQAEMGNAFYCATDHTIYFDAIFFTKLMKSVGDANGTDGDMAIIFVLAHEWGHAVQRLTGTSSETSIINESNADCTAGAFTLYAYQQGDLEKGDIEEAVSAISNFGDDLPFNEHGAHGDSSVRLSMFKRGVERGLPACGKPFGR
jgi:predicted metalloprotease